MKISFKMRLIIVLCKRAKKTNLKKITEAQLNKYLTQKKNKG